MAEDIIPGDIVTGGIITLEYAKTGLKWTGTSTARDDDLVTYIKAATPIIEDLVGPVLPRSKTKRFNGGKSGVLLPDPITEEAVTVVAEDGHTITDFLVDADAAIIYAGQPGAQRRFAPGVQNIAVTYTVGFVTIPETLQLATRELVRTWVQQGMQSNRPSFDDAGTSDSVATPMGFAVPRRVYELCAPFINIPGIG